MNDELMKNLNQEFDCMKKVYDSLQELNKYRNVYNQIDYCEKSFGRNLTEEEKNIVLEKGKEALFDRLGLDETDFNTMLRAFALISAGFTESSDRYDYELEQNNYKALDLFKSLVNDLECVEADKRKSKIGTKEDLKTKIKVEGSDVGGYKEENDPDLDELFRDSEKSINPNKIFIAEETYKEDPDLNKVFASATRCDEMHITGDAYDESKDPDIFKNEKECNKTSLEEKIKKAIERLDKGCELELDEETIDAIIEKLFTERDNVSIKIHNNKISLR